MTLLVWLLPSAFGRQRYDVMEFLARLHEKARASFV